MTSAPIAPRPYEMSLGDFLEILLPALSRFPFGDGVQLLSTAQKRNLWLASMAREADESFSRRYERSDAADTLIGLLHPSVMETAISLRHNFETLRRAHDAGYADVQILASDRCRCLHDLLDGRTVKIQSLLAAFNDQAAEMPLLPPAQTPCGHLDSPSICAVRLVPVQNLRQPGDDMAFADWLETTLTGGKVRKELELNWRDVLAARTARLKASE